MATLMRCEIICFQGISDKVKFFIGYSGWEKGQLKNEIKANSWAVGHSDDQRVLEDTGEAFWKHSVVGLGEQYKPWIQYPKDPFLN